MSETDSKNKYIIYGVAAVAILVIIAALLIFAAAAGGKLNDTVGFESKTVPNSSEIIAVSQEAGTETVTVRDPLLKDLPNVALSVDVSYQDGYFTDSLRPNTAVIVSPFTLTQTKNIQVLANNSSADVVRAEIVSGAEYVGFSTGGSGILGINEIYVKNGTFALQPKNTAGKETGTATIKVTAEDGDFIEEKTFQVTVGSANGGKFPYLIANAGDFEKIRQKIPDNKTAGTNYVMVDDIDYEGGEWTPIGTSELGQFPSNSFDVYLSNYSVESFSGSFDGSGHTFSNYTITTGTSNQYRGVNGFFASVNNATISNFSLDNGTVNIAAADNFVVPNGFKGTSVYAGQLAGVANGKNTVIDNCSANGTVTVVSNSSQNVTIKASSGVYVQTLPEVNVGGLVGILNGRLTNSSADVQVAADAKNLVVGGGLVGKSTGNISGSSASGNVDIVGGTDDLSFNNKHGSSAGGLVGAVSGSVGSKASVSDCYATGDVTVKSNGNNGNNGNDSAATYRVYAGGIAGTVSYGTVQNSYANGTVKAIGGYGVVPEGGEEIILYDTLDVSDTLGNTGKQTVSDAENEKNILVIPESFVYGGFAGGIAGMANETSVIQNSVAANPEVTGSGGSARIVGTAGGFDSGVPTMLNLGDKYTWKTDGARTFKANPKAMIDDLTLSGNAAYNNMLIGTENNPEFAIGFIGPDRVNGKGETSAFLKTYEAYSEWDFDKIWKMDTFPVFKWQD
ncbi:hypothetical protein MsAg5_10820 [Methanosarcinaceae archaeon Ag5]|uniref:GLUG domain-containing protein n=1 Tax=Methanolapillus africanus TaxID=3028297 RepID=A0AAE4SE31_9EURY|nr:hypothetical protein [Methanosarcinaceae archaeon Ag5]